LFLSGLSFDDDSLDAARFVDNTFEQSSHGGGIERAAVDASNVLYHLLFAVGRVYSKPHLAFYAAQLNRALRPLVEQPDELFVYAVNLFSPMFDAHGFSQTDSNNSVYSNMQLGTTRQLQQM
jgi:hypothetical protein